jgi:tRNA nucleotidyltransferase (CCA-adding enzyme)
MENINLAHEIEERLPPRALGAISKARGWLAARGEKLFLAGGAVRDLLLEKPVSDVDLVLEGDAMALAAELARVEDVKITLHKPFLTANLAWPDLGLDLTTARREKYVRPGALPEVQPGSLEDDMLRRDFSINAMAVSLNTEDNGRLVDFCGGLDDLHNKLVRTLHEKSFIDDATRIWRAVRYEQRLDFRLESGTESLLKRDLAMLDTISGERIWYELECVFGEELPEKVFERAGELGLLSCLDPALNPEGRLAAWFDGARRMSLPLKPENILYLALLTFPLDDRAVDRIAQRLKVTRATAQTLHETHEIKSRQKGLSLEPLKPSAIYRLLHGFSEDAVRANLLASASEKACRNITLYLDKLRYVKTLLHGEELIAFGIKQGPSIKTILGQLLEARLDGEVSTREDEVRLLRQISLFS